YLLGVLVVGVVVACVVTRRWPEPRVLAASALGACLFVAVGAALAVPYYRVAAASTEIREELKGGETHYFSPPPVAFLAASRESLLWSAPTAGARRQVRSSEEDSLFPGLTIVVLAGIGLVTPSVPRRVRVVLGVAIVVTATLSLGYGLLHGVLGFAEIWSR